MILTPEQQALLDGKEGEIMAKIVKTLVMYGEAFGAKRMVPVTSKYGHTVISFGLEVMKPVYDLYDKLIAAGLPEGQKFTADPKPLDPKVPSSLLDDLVFKKIMYTQQKRYEEQMRKLGITDDADTPAPATWTRLATSRKRATCSPGRNPPPWSTPTPFWVPAATATPACWS